MLERTLNWSGRMAARLYASILLKTDLRWHVQLPDGPKIIAANHPTTTDAFLMMALASEPISILITETCFKVPVLSLFLRRAGHIPVVEGSERVAFDRAVALLRAGQSVGIFPEGALSPLGGEACHAHTGVVRLALSTGAPVIPVGIHLQHERIHFFDTHIGGKYEVARWYLRGRYAITVGKPMRLEGDVEDREHVRTALRRVMLDISQLSGESVRRMVGAQMAISGLDVLPS